jgi:hypothetical protein
VGLRSFSLIVLLWAITCGSGMAYETDQFSNRRLPLRDSAPVLNREVNTALADIVAHWQGPRDDNHMVMAIFHRLGGYYWVDHLERFAMDSPEVDRLPTPRRQSIYRGLPIYATRVAAVFGVAPTIRVGSTLFGTDKIGHFFSQGRKFWQRWHRNGNEQHEADVAARVEGAIFGTATTGTYSNADLSADFEGYRFYRSLFEDGIVPGKPAILHWQDDHWQIQRPFDWNDHVNNYWDEALNTSSYSKHLRRALLVKLHEFCGDYAQDPALYQLDPTEDAALAARYHEMHLRPDPALRLGAICADEPSVQPTR